MLYNITYACGCTKEVQLYGKKEDRDNKAAWLATQDCYDCQRKQQDEAAKKAAEALQLPDLDGSPKQIAWAEKLRMDIFNKLEDKGMVSNFASYIDAKFDKANIKTWVEFFKSHGHDNIAQEAKGFFASQTSAKFWIDNRDNNWQDILANYYRAKMVEQVNSPQTEGENKKEEETKKETIEMTNTQNVKAVAVTHSGAMHADDIFAGALLQIVNPDTQIIRVRDAKDAPEGALVFDIGGGQYDHHQPDKAIRANGVPYAAFGLIWRDYGGRLVPEEFVDQFDKDFVQQIDGPDNGAPLTPLYSAFAAFNPNWDEAGDFDAAYFKAVDVAKTILVRQFAKYNAAANATQGVYDAIVRSFIDGSPAVILPQFMPWQDAFFKHSFNSEFNYIIFPAARGGYQVQAIPTTLNGRDQRKPFPVAWVEQKPEGATFVHNGRFLVGTATLEDAIKIANMANKGVE